MFAAYFINISLIAEWCALIASILFLNKKTGIWQFFIPYLFLTVCTEIVGGYESYVLKVTNNALPYNILLIISVVFFVYVLSNADLLKRFKKAFFIIIICFIVLSFINLFFLQGLWIYNSYSETIGDILLTIISCYFFYTILKDDVFRDLFKDEYFWLVTGLLFSSIGSVLLYFFLSPLQVFAEKTHIPIYKYINNGVNLLLYINLIIAFICRRANTK
ncbi:MAG TPA: hypothetical protein VIJ75_07980 [Hanamia sp.]